MQQSEREGGVSRPAFERRWWWPMQTQHDGLTMYAATCARGHGGSWPGARW